MNRALVTIVFGDKYRQGFEKYAYPTWKTYAQKWGYDIRVIEYPIDQSERALQRSIAWQKCLIFDLAEVQRYDQVAWVDCDILINPEAPELFENVPIEKIGAVAGLKSDHILQPPGTEDQNERGYRFHTDYGLPGTFNTIVSTGVLILSPRHHAATLRYVYDTYEDKGGNEWNFEMRPLSHELQARHSLHWIDPRFNTMWVTLRENFYPFLGEKSPSGVWAPLGPGSKIARYLMASDCTKAALKSCFFLHFAGTGFAEMAFSSEAHALETAQRVLFEALQPKASSS